MNKDLIAFCGLDCAECEAYKAIIANDSAWQQRILEKWKVEFNAPQMTLDSVLCTGCHGTGKLCGYCSQCAVRACAMERKLATCADCSDYGCEKLVAFFKMAPQAQANLEALRK
jgi:hypothetical protein